MTAGKFDWFKSENSTYKWLKQGGQMKTKVKNTPPPWKVAGEVAINLIPSGIFEIFAHGKFVARANSRADAELIVRAVNAHEELVGFLREISDLAKENCRSVQDGYAMIAEWADKALAKAEGKGS